MTRSSTVISRFRLQIILFRFSVVKDRNVPTVSFYCEDAHANVAVDIGALSSSTLNGLRASFEWLRAENTRFELRG